MLKDLQNRKYRESLVTMYVQVLLSNNTVHCGYIVNPRRETTKTLFLEADNRGYCKMEEMKQERRIRMLLFSGCMTALWYTEKASPLR